MCIAQELHRCLPANVDNCQTGHVFVYNFDSRLSNTNDMNILLNGEPRPLNNGTQLAQLVRDLGLQDKRLAIEINREIIPRSQYANTELKNGDTIEIVHAIGGG